MNDDKPLTFCDRLEEWRCSLGDGHNAFARRLGISHGYWHQLRTGDRAPSPELMASAIALAPEPWRSALRAARQVDQDAIDRRAAALATA